MTIKKIFVLLLVIILFIPSMEAKNDKEEYNYELSLALNNVATTSGYKIFKVWSYGRKKEALTQELCMRNAVHGILFKGLVGADEGAQGSVPPLCPEGYNAHKDYFDHFFKSGDFMQYIQLTSKGAQQAGDVIKLPKRRWKVGLLVQVNVNGLRERLIHDGIISGVKDIFSADFQK